MSRTSEWSLPLRFPHHKTVWPSSLHHTCHMSRPSLSSWFETLEKISGGDYKSWSFSVCSFPLSPTTSSSCFPQHPISEHSPMVYSSLTVKFNRSKRELCGTSSAALPAVNSTDCLQILHLSASLQGVLAGIRSESSGIQKRIVSICPTLQWTHNSVDRNITFT